MSDELLGRQSAIAEPRVLYRMIGADSRIEELRELIAVPPKIERALQAEGESTRSPPDRVESKV